jgi:hypothetical protein
MGPPLGATHLAAQIGGKRYLDEQSGSERKKKNYTILDDARMTRETDPSITLRQLAEIRSG